MNVFAIWVAVILHCSWNNVKEKFFSLLGTNAYSQMFIHIYPYMRLYILFLQKDTYVYTLYIYILCQKGVAYNYKIMYIDILYNKIMIVWRQRFQIAEKLWKL